MKEGKINALSSNKEEIKEFLMSLPEVKNKIINEIIKNIEKVDVINSLNLLSSKENKIFIFNLLSIFSSKDKLSSYSEECLNFLCKKMDLETDYIEELLEAEQKISSALDYANELINE